MRGPGKGKSNNPAGKPKGTQNRTTKEAKALLNEIMFGQIDNIAQSLDNIREESDYRYIDAITKLFSFVLPKHTDIELTGDKFNITFTSADNKP